MIELPKPEAKPRFGLAAAVSWLVVFGIAFLAVKAAVVLTPWGFVGAIRDDGIYLLAARALREGLGYVDLSLPGHPGALRYPPGYPFMLMLATLGAKSTREEIFRAQVLPIACGVVSVLLSYRYLQRWGGLSRTVAVIGTAWCTFNHQFLLMCARVMSDIPFGTYGLVAALVFESAMAASGVPLLGWAGMGVLFGGAMLVRYAGVALVAAGGGVLALERRWKPLGAFILGVALVVLPWLLYRHHLGGGDYMDNYSRLFPKDLHDLSRACGLVLAGLIVGGLPGMLCGLFYPATGPMVPDTLGFVVGTVVSLLVFLGLGWGLARKPAGRTQLAELYLAATIAVGSVYALSFTWYADNFLQRSFIPLLPFIMLVSLRGAWLAAGFLPDLLRRMTLSAWIFFGVLLNVGGSVFYMMVYVPDPHLSKAYADIYRAVREKVPADALMVAYDGHMVTLYTDRACLSAPNAMQQPGVAPKQFAPRDALRFLVLGRPAYFVGTPDVDNALKYDRMVRLANSVMAYAPGLLTPIYSERMYNFTLFKIDIGLLDRAQEILDNTPDPEPGKND